MCPRAIPAWTRPFDVSTLAMDAVGDAASAAERLARARGLDVHVDTTPSLVAGSFAAIDHVRIDGRPVEAWGELSGFFAADDGWVRLHGNYPHHQAAIRRALRVEDREGAAAAIRRLPAGDAVEWILARGGIATTVRTREDWDSHPQARAMRDVPWHRVEAGEERVDPPVGRRLERSAHAGTRTRDAAGATGSSPSAPLPLDGVRVLDLTRVVAGPMGTQLLACLGADVLRVDPPHRPELLDAHLASGMGKRSAVLDLATSAGILDGLLSEADVVVLGYRPGSLSRFGLAPEALRDRFPHLVIGTLSAWGEVGPWGERAGFDSIVQAATGIADVCATRQADGAFRPGALPVQALDHSTGHRLAAGILDLLAAGRGGSVRAHLLGAARELLRGRAEGTTGTAGPMRDAPQGSDTSAADDVPAGTSPDEPELVVLPSAHGEIRTVPVPLRLDGVALSGALAEYGTASPSWRRAATDSGTAPVDGS